MSIGGRCCRRTHLHRLGVDARATLLRPLLPALRVDFDPLGADGLNVGAKLFAGAFHACLDQELPVANLPLLLEAQTGLAFASAQAGSSVLRGFSRVHADACAQHPTHPQPHADDDSRAHVR